MVEGYPRTEWREIGSGYGGEEGTGGGVQDGGVRGSKKEVAYRSEAGTGFLGVVPVINKTIAGIMAVVDKQKGRRVYYLSAFDGRYILTDPTSSKEVFRQEVGRLQDALGELYDWAISSPHSDENAP